MKFKNNINAFLLFTSFTFSLLYRNCSSPLWVVQCLGEVVEFLLKQEAGRPLLEALAHHGGVGAVGGAESIIDVDVAQLLQLRTEKLHGRGLCLVLGEKKTW